MKSSLWPTPAAIPRPPACWSAPRRFTPMSIPRLTMSPDSAARAFSSRTKAVVLTHLYGKMADVAGVQQVVAGRNIAVIEDCAQAHGATSANRPAGSLGDLGVFSFYPTKNLGTMGDGGAIVTQRPDYAERARMLRQYGWAEKYRAVLPEGRNSRLDELHAAILRKKLPHLDAWNQRRREIVARYHAAAAGNEAALRSPAWLRITWPISVSPATRTAIGCKSVWTNGASASPFTIRFPIIGRSRCAAVAGGRLNFQTPNGPSARFSLFRALRK